MAHRRGATFVIELPSAQVEATPASSQAAVA
jgi:hypothetical protein